MIFQDSMTVTMMTLLIGRFELITTDINDLGYQALNDEIISPSKNQNKEEEK